MMIPLYLLLLLTWAATALAAPRPSHSFLKRELEAYEERYIRSQNYQYHNQTVKLIGYQSIKIPAENLDSFETHYSTNAHTLQELFPSHFYDASTAELRIYFPVASALLDHDGSTMEANHLGEFEHDALDGDYAVLGRKQTPQVRGVARNIIRDGTIFLAKRNHPVRQIGNTRIYDFGYRSLDHDHSHSPVKRHSSALIQPRYTSAAPQATNAAVPHPSPGPSPNPSPDPSPDPSPSPSSGSFDNNPDQGETNDNGEGQGENEEAPNNGCGPNHGGENCSKAYGINYDPETGMYHGSCASPSDGPSHFDGLECMDYNGPGTVCDRTYKYLFFLGSDCFYSVKNGNCWNEVEDAE